MLTVTDKPKKPGNRGRGRPPSEDPKRINVGVRLTGDLAEALDRYIKSLEIEPLPPAVLRAALEQFLEAKGFWPLREGGDS